MRLHMSCHLSILVLGPLSLYVSRADARCCLVVAFAVRAVRLGVSFTVWQSMAGFPTSGTGWNRSSAMFCSMSRDLTEFTYHWPRYYWWVLKRVKLSLTAIGNVVLYSSITVRVLVSFPGSSGVGRKNRVAFRHSAANSMSTSLQSSGTPFITHLALSVLVFDTAVPCTVRISVETLWPPYHRYVWPLEDRFFVCDHGMWPVG